MIKRVVRMQNWKVFLSPLGGLESQMLLSGDTVQQGMSTSILVSVVFVDFLTILCQRLFIIESQRELSFVKNEKKIYLVEYLKASSVSYFCYSFRTT